MGGRFDVGGACAPTIGGGCPFETPCDNLVGDWYDSCGDVIAIGLDRDLQGRRERGTVRRSGSREVTGEWRCAAGDEARSIDIAWSGEPSEQRHFRFDQHPFFVDPGFERLHWSADPVAGGRRGTEEEVAYIAKNGDAQFTLVVTNCGPEPIRKVSLRWRHEGARDDLAPPEWLTAESVRVEPTVLQLSFSQVSTPNSSSMGIVWKIHLSSPVRTS